jgi:hypothetical protein
MRSRLVSITIALAFAVAASPASAITLDPVSYTAYLCTASCDSPTSGTMFSGPNSTTTHSAAVSPISSGQATVEANVSPSPKPDPYVLATAFATNGNDLRADIYYIYDFGIVGGTATPTGVPVTINGSITLGGSGVNDGKWISFAEVSLGQGAGAPKSISATYTPGDTQTFWNISKTYEFSTNTKYWIELYVDAHAISQASNSSANDVYAMIDPTLTIDPAFANDYSIVFSPGIASTPLPSSWTMLLGGLGWLGFLTCRRTKKNSGTMVAA